MLLKLKFKYIIGSRYVSQSFITLRLKYFLLSLFFAEIWCRNVQAVHQSLWVLPVFNEHHQLFGCISKKQFDQSYLKMILLRVGQNECHDLKNLLSFVFIVFIKIFIENVTGICLYLKLLLFLYLYL